MIDTDLKGLLVSIGDIMRQFREEEGLGQREVAQRIGATQATISYLENGKKDIFLSTLLRVARFYGCDLEIQFVPMVDDATKEFNEALLEAVGDIEEEWVDNLKKGLMDTDG